MKWILSPLIALLLYIGLEQLIELRTKGFCLQKILATDLPPHDAWEVEPSSLEKLTEINALLDQPFTLIGAGSECFAFKSRDSKTVIKFFKLSHTRPVYFLKGLLREDYSSYAGTLSNHQFLNTPLPEPLTTWRQRLFGIREFRITRTFSSLKLAYRELKEETGILYLHLNPTVDLHKTLTLIDGSGIRHQVPLDSTPFLLQQYAVPLEEHFSQLLSKNELNEAKRAIDSLFELILNRCRKGFGDRDFINRNIGYIGNTAIEIDMGSFHRDERMKQKTVYQRELFFTTLELRAWLKENSPELLAYCEGRLKDLICKDVELKND